MELVIGDQIVYEDPYGDSFKGKIIEIWTNDNEEITGYFATTDSGLYVHFKPISLKWVRLEEHVPVP